MTESPTSLTNWTSPSEIESAKGGHLTVLLDRRFVNDNDRIEFSDRKLIFVLSLTERGARIKVSLDDKGRRENPSAALFKLISCFEELRRRRLPIIFNFF